ncbi:MAG: DUF4097 family beta strand repeat-containing protein [Oscillospiraceae bacterium]
MNKTEFLNELRQRLIGLPLDKIDQAVDYYDKIISESDCENEEDIISRLGSLDDISAKIFADNNMAYNKSQFYANPAQTNYMGNAVNNPAYSYAKQPKKKKTWLVVLIIVIALIAVVGIVLSLVFGAGIVVKLFKNNDNISRENVYEQFSAADIQKLDFESGIGDFYVDVSDNDLITVQGDNLSENCYTFEVDSGTLKIEYNEENIHNWLGIADKIGNDNEIHVTLPAKVYKEFDFSAGAGDTFISNLSVTDLEISGGVGNVTVNNVTSVGKAELSLGVGETYINESSFNKSKFEVGTGNLEFSGKLKGHTKIENGIGNTEMNIDGYKSEYNINYDNGVGNVDINGSEYNNNAAQKIDIFLDNGVGNITLNFK